MRKIFDLGRTITGEQIAEPIEMQLSPAKMKEVEGYLKFVQEQVNQQIDLDYRNLVYADGTTFEEARNSRPFVGCDPASGRDRTATQQAPHDHNLIDLGPESVRDATNDVEREDRMLGAGLPGKKE